MRGGYLRNGEAMVMNSSLYSGIRLFGVLSNQPDFCTQLMCFAICTAPCVLRSFLHNCMCMSHQGSSWMLWVLTGQQQKKKKTGRSSDTKGKGKKGGAEEGGGEKKRKAEEAKPC